MEQLFLAVLFVSVPDMSATDGDVEQASSLAGVWHLLQTRNEKRPEAGCESIRMKVARDGSVVFTFRDMVTNRGSFKVLSGRRVDLLLSDGRTCVAIFALRGDALLICFDEAGKGRPGSIEPKGSQWVEHWKRR